MLDITKGVKFKIIFINILFTIVLLLLLNLSDGGNISYIAVIGIFQYIWMVFSWYTITKNIMNIYLFFLVLSFFFYLGQPVLYLFGIKVTSVMTIESSPFSTMQIANTLKFLLRAMALFHFGALFSISAYKDNPKVKINLKSIKFIGVLFFMVSAIPQVQFTFESLKTTLAVGYGSIFNSEFVQGTGFNGGILRFLAGFFKASLILLIMGSKDNKKKLKFWITLTIVFGLIMIMSGQRGSNSLFIIGVILLYNYMISPFTKRQIIGFIGITMISAFTLGIISAIRNLGVANYSFHELITMLASKNYFFELLGEMGFTLIACTTVMVYSPSVIPFNNGATYYSSLFGLVPNLFWKVNPAANGGVDQVFKSLLMNGSGMGSSFIIEAYYNFGVYGLILMPIFGYFIGKLYFDTIKASRDKDYLKLYVCIYMSFIVLWFVRSETITFWRNFGYYALLPVILIRIKTAFGKNRKYDKLPIDN